MSDAPWSVEVRELTVKENGARIWSTWEKASFHKTRDSARIASAAIRNAKRITRIRKERAEAMAETLS